MTHAFFTATWHKKFYPISDNPPVARGEFEAKANPQGIVIRTASQLCHNHRIGAIWAIVSGSAPMRVGVLILASLFSSSH